jgi:UDP-glucose:(heptosyl)LPS alpha-1,3-glucosyltransferase
MVKQDVMRWYGIPEGRVVVIYNGVNTERFHPRNRQYRDEIRGRHGVGNEFLILFVSNNFRMKGLGYLVKTLAEIRKEDRRPFKLLVLGRDRQGPYLRLAKKTGISKEVVFVGSTDEPEKYYGAADLLVHPTFYDACSLTVLEAQASGLPVVTTVSNGASGLISHGEDGWVIEEMQKGIQLKTAITYFLNKEIQYLASFEESGMAETHSAKVNVELMMGIFRGVTGVTL